MNLSENVDVRKALGPAAAALERAERTLTEDPPEGVDTGEWYRSRGEALTSEERAVWDLVYGSPDFLKHVYRDDGWAWFRNRLSLGNLVRFGAFWVAVGLLLRYLA